MDPGNGRRRGKPEPATTGTLPIAAFDVSREGRRFVAEMSTRSTSPSPAFVFGGRWCTKASSIVVALAAALCVLPTTCRQNEPRVSCRRDAGSTL